MKRMMILSVLSAFMLLSGCTAENYLPDIQGKIIQITNGNSKEILGVILVEEGLEKNAKVDKASVTVTNKTEILRLEKENTSQKTDYSALKEGQFVEVIFTGEIKESYPIQTTAKVIIIKPQKGNGSDQVELNIKREYQAGETMNLTMINNGPSQISFGRPYLIEQWKDGIWSEYPLEVNFTMELILLKQGENFEQAVPLEDFKAGRYRLIKNIRIEDSQTNLNLVKEFEISSS